MANTYYIQRTLISDEDTYSEDQLLRSSDIIVVLAEPGAGKTHLLNSLAQRMSVKSEKASLFQHRNKVLNTDILVLDAVDEIAKLDPSGIDAIFVKAKETGAKKVIFAGRSSEWEEARTIRIRECFNYEKFGFSGIHIISNKIFKFLKPGIYSIIDAYLDLAKTQKISYYEHTNDFWADLGTLESLNKNYSKFISSLF